MKKSRYSDSQIIAILKQAETGTPVPDLYREHGMSSASFYKGPQNPLQGSGKRAKAWRTKYDGMGIIDGTDEGTRSRECPSQKNVC